MGQVEEKHYLNPKLGKTVYCIYDYGIFADTVGYLGKESFIVDSFGDSTCDDSWEWSFDSYNELWFTSLAKAKKKLREELKNRYSGRFKIVQANPDYWTYEVY